MTDAYEAVYARAVTAAPRRRPPVGLRIDPARVRPGS